MSQRDQSVHQSPTSPPPGTSRRTLLRAAGMGLVAAPFVGVAGGFAYAEESELDKLKRLPEVANLDDPRTNVPVSQEKSSLADPTKAGVTAQQFLDSCAADIGKTGDDYVWLGLADFTGDAYLKDWAAQDAPYCAGGMQLNRWRLGLEGYPAELPYYVPSLKQYAAANNHWLSLNSAKPGDFVCLFNLGHVGVLERNNDNGTITTIEYNTSEGNGGSQTNGNGCWRRVRNVDDIDGFIRHHDFGGEGGGGEETAPTLRRGDKGTRVKTLQTTLNTWFPSYPEMPLVVDSSFGPATEAALKEFQRRAGLTVDGVFGLLTRTKLANITGVLV
ncbi:peptidoglycan-binding protein [Parenemella sanctibonifatiensis]|uniref:Peptidoglycan binding-like domain-containing protein n=1 Tax=Parenemella sanctibonifatiensis TaxID=2016505 RepID=A0A255E9M8_9ACTN|nr:peptidoglycan-binding protein [Parenemella sanctibonifatiensis]OYN88277.1 hypothetical protein CGZ92_04890 [Parenemella sanctibonifatiensis]